MPAAVSLWRAAEECLGPRLGLGFGGRLVLSLFFKAILGIQRVFHFETLHDKGFAILSGGTRVLSRQVLGGLVRAAPVRGVLRFMRRTEPRVTLSPVLPVSIDEHAVPRFTRKFDIRKGFHTIRNKHMKVEKLFFSFQVATRQLLSLVVTRGNAGLAALTAQMLPRLRRRARGAQIRLILDAGAANDHAALLSLADHPNQVTLVRVPRRPVYRKAWQALPEACWTRHEEPGRYQRAPAKIIHLAETHTMIGPKNGKVSVRTIVVREQAGRGKERWHALWVFGDELTDPYQIVQEFRTRQHHEQRYRTLLHDAYVDTAPSGYDKKSKTPSRPGFKQNALTIYAWVAALATNVLETFEDSLPADFRHAHPRTLRRWLFNSPANLYLTKNTLVVLLDSVRPRHLRSVFESLIDATNRRRIRIPWLANRRLILSMEQRSLMAEGAFDPLSADPAVWC